MTYLLRMNNFVVASIGALSRRSAVEKAKSFMVWLEQNRTAIWSLYRFSSKEGTWSVKPATKEDITYYLTENHPYLLGVSFSAGFK